MILQRFVGDAGFLGCDEIGFLWIYRVIRVQYSFIKGENAKFCALSLKKVHLQRVTEVKMFSSFANNYIDVRRWIKKRKS